MKDTTTAAPDTTTDPADPQVQHAASQTLAVLPPVLAVATKGRYYLRRSDDGIDEPLRDELGNPRRWNSPATSDTRGSSGPDVAACTAHDAVVCSLCLSTDTRREHVLPADPPALVRR